MLSHLEQDIQGAAEEVGRSRAERTSLLLDELARCADEGAREALLKRIVVVNMELADTLARRYFGHGEQVDDLRQTAYLALHKAVGRFDPSRGHDFLSYAVPTILGELRRHFRDGCWMVRPPRRVQELQARVMSVTERFNQGHGRDPDPWEMAEELGVDVDDVVEAMSADGCFTPSSIDKPLDEGGQACLADVLGGDDPSFDRVEVHLLLKSLVEDLPERDHLIIELRFFRDWTQAQIGQELGVTQMQVSRLLARILSQLRSQLPRASDVAA